MRVAIIDNGVNLSNNSKSDDNHGSNIAKIILHEAPQTEILSFIALSEKNKGKLKYLIKAISEAMEKKADIINMSLGFTSEGYKNLRAFHDICIEAYKRGIILVAAYKNGENKSLKSYPADFEEVIGVGYDKDIENAILIEHRAFFFPSGAVYIPRSSSVKVGSSYLAAYVTGLIANERIHDYYGAVNLFKNKYRDGVFLNKTTFDFPTFFRGKRFCYWGNINCTRDWIQVEKFYSQWMEGEFCNNSREIPENKYTKMDILILGLYCEEVEKELMNKIILEAANHKKDIIMPFPYINTKERKKLQDKFNIRVLSLYL